MFFSQLIKATADIMELSKTEVSFAVEAKQCDPIFAVYNILLQEELKQYDNRSPKTVSSIVIRDHSNTTRLLPGGTAEKRRKMNENYGKCTRNILPKSRLRSMQAKRVWAVKQRGQFCVERYVSFWRFSTCANFHAICLENLV